MKKICALGNKLTLIFLELAGITKIIKIDEPQEALNKIEVLIKTKDYAIIIVTSQIYHQIKEKIEEIQERKQIPIIVDIPEVKLKELT